MGVYSTGQRHNVFISSVSVSGELSDGIIVLIVSGSLIGLAFVVSMVYSTIKKCQRCCRKYDCCHKCTNCNRIFADEVDADYLEAAEYYLRLRALASALINRSGFRIVEEGGGCEGIVE